MHEVSMLQSQAPWGCGNCNVDKDREQQEEMVNVQDFNPRNFKKQFQPPKYQKCGQSWWKFRLESLRVNKAPGRRLPEGAATLVEAMTHNPSNQPRTSNKPSKQGSKQARSNQVEEMGVNCCVKCQSQSKEQQLQQQQQTQEVKRVCCDC